jgi:hypothetical protein
MPNIIAMPSFPDLPVDVVDTILAFSEFRVLEAFSRTSKSLRELAERYLYREIKVRYCDEESDTDLSGGLLNPDFVSDDD